MKPQVTTAIDKKLNRASRTIGRADKAIATHEEKRKNAWELFITSANDHNDPRLRFVADDGHYMTLQWRQGNPKRNDPLLRQKLQALVQDAEWRAEHFQPAEGEEPFSADEAFWNIWDSITDQTVNSEKLEAAYQAGRIPAEVLEETITVPDPTYARIRQPWTKDDANRAVVFGVTQKP